MPRYELTLSPDYVAKWGLWEGVRELLQNAIDQDSPSTEMFCKYDSDEQALVIGNMNTTLHHSTLLLGKSNKSSTSHIGQYGEGYKLAFIALLRAGKRITVFNNGKLWTPRFIKSRRFGGHEILVIDIEKTKSTFAVPRLQFTINGVTPHDYASVMSKCLVGSTPASIDTAYGKILLQKEFQRQVFVKGLYVCTMPEKIKYGYNMNPGCIQLDRDRNKIQSFNLYWETSRMWASLPQTFADRAYKLITAESPEIEYLKDHSYNTSLLYQDLCNMSHTAFLAKHGKTAVPVKNDDEARLIQSKYNELVPVTVPATHYEFIRASTGFTNSETKKILDAGRAQETPYIICKKFLDTYLQAEQETADVFKHTILEPSRNWSRRDEN